MEQPRSVVKRRYRVRGRDQGQLLRRISTLLQAIRLRGGSILGITWSAAGALVRYEVPVVVAGGAD